MRRGVSAFALVTVVLLAAGVVVGGTLGMVLLALGALAALALLADGLGLTGINADRSIDVAHRREALARRGPITPRDPVPDGEPRYDEDAWARERADRLIDDP